jgi:tetratricopeptide (TPR) repeat protein
VKCISAGDFSPAFLYQGMKKSNKLRLFLWIFFTVVVFFIGYALWIYASNKPPVEEITRARETLADAKTKLMGKYGAVTLNKAEKLFEQSVSEWESQNKKLFFLRDYSLAADLADKSYKQTLTAMAEGQKSQVKLKQNAESKLISLSQQIDHFETCYKSLPLRKSTYDLYHSGKMSFLEARIEYENEEYMKALKMIFKAEENLSQALKVAHIKLVDFYKAYPEWEKNTQSAYNLSKKGQTVFLIDKIEASLIVLKSGKEFKIFPVEFGDNWMGNKSMVGDKATPEGVYKVLAKKNSSKTKYYKALLLNYPNSDDKKRFNELVRTCKISKNTGIGGSIEIHGEGGTGIHWTNGCIALENKDMDLVYNLSSVNTPVIIVGSRITLEQYLN